MEEYSPCVDISWFAEEQSGVRFVPLSPFPAQLPGQLLSRLALCCKGKGQGLAAESLVFHSDVSA